MLADTPMTCEEKLRLLVDYQRLTVEHSRSIGNMAVRGMTTGDYERMASQTEKARFAVAEARNRLNRHIAEHGC
jgi:hypothetical protein